MDHTAAIVILAAVLQATSWAMPRGRFRRSEDSVQDDGPDQGGTTTYQISQWPTSSTGMVTVPYDVLPGYKNWAQTLFGRCLQELSTLSCVQFVPHTTETDYISIQPGSGCWSYVGKVGGAQTVAIEPLYCTTQYIVQHEVLHALGFIHEVQRRDRDNYVKILYDNIAPADQSRFDKVTNYSPLLSYDYKSVMHWYRNAFSKNGGDTIVPTPDPDVSVGPLDGVSPMDIAKLNTYYKCNLCRKLITGNNGFISSTSNPKNSSCLYLIRAATDNILLTFQAFDLANSTNCSSDYLQVYDGLTTSSPVILDRACGRSLPYPLMSSSNFMLFEFVSNKAGAGFQASYTTVTCGGIYSRSGLSVTSPSYPVYYPNNMNCFYRIIAPPGYKVKVQFYIFFTPVVPNCDTSGDHLDIYDGSDYSAPLLYKLCSYIDETPVVISTGNNMALHFVSDNFATAPGFSLTYTFIPGKASS